MGKLIVIGIDGAPWELVDRFIASGSLPTFMALVETGVSSDLMSTIPPVTSPAWKCYSTGKNPGRLGAFWWTKVDFADRKLSFITAADFRSRDYWDYISDAGKYCVQINMPMSYPPPKEWNGIFVSGVPALENDDYTVPKELKAKLLERHDYRITLETAFEVNFEKAIGSVSRLIDMRFDVAEEHIEKADFLQVSLFFIDDAQHFLWKEMKERTGKHKDAIEELWRQIDTRLGRLLERAGDDAHVVIFSDHGFTDLKGAFYINEWLGPELVTKRPVVKMGKRSGSERLMLLLDWLHLTKYVRRLFSEERRKQFQESRKKEELDRRVFFEWDRTRVYGTTEGPLYINRALVPDDAEYEALRDRLVKDLEALVYPVTGERVIDKVWKREEAYHGPFVHMAPDLVAVPALGYEISGNVWEDGHQWATVDDFHNGWTGCHRMEGILILEGPEVRQGVRLGSARIYDVAPTVLALMGLPIPNDMDGRVLAEAMRDPERFQRMERVEGGIKEPLEHQLSEEDEEAIQKRLEALGYM